MTVPDYQTLMRPTLAAVADGQDHALGEIRGRLASEFHLTDEDMAERIRTGMPVWNSRVHWALAYLCVDGIIREDPLGLGRVYLQAKRYGADRKVNRPDVQGFVGAILGHGADRGVFIATCEFSDGAIEYATNSERTRVILIDGSRLAHLMIQYGVGVQVTDTFRISELDEDFFDPDR